ncbi:unnamed protein product [Meloidogyne enterolobii]|uniref:Uncharacterized protein n=1 Tax=Meloidogyne enterolobii TaxID=390850 RepID=A0ACB0Y0X1_MELEN
MLNTSSLLIFFLFPLKNFLNGIFSKHFLNLATFDSSTFSFFLFLQFFAKNSSVPFSPCSVILSRVLR